MAGSALSVDPHAPRAGENHLELLLFHLNGRQRFGINVFKVQEVIPCPPLTAIPRSHPAVLGLATLRGRNMAIVDLRPAIGGRACDDRREQTVIVCEYNRQMLGFLVGGVQRIVDLDWQAVLPPPQASGRNGYMTAVTRVDGELIQIIDLEKVMLEILGEPAELDPDVISPAVLASEQHALVVDDSSVARYQLQQLLAALGIDCTLCRDGREAYRCLQAWRDGGKQLSGWLAFVLSDIEMPRMDGYTLTRRIRQEPDMQDLHVILHTSLSGAADERQVAEVGADRFIAKWDPELLAGVVQEQLQLHAERVTA